jgi:hypothetical protein
MGRLLDSGSIESYLHENIPISRAMGISVVESGFSARCRMPSAAQWLRFDNTLRRRQRAKIQLVAEIVADGKTAARHTGDFVVLNGFDQG